MENLKIRVSTAEESKEAQELLFALGCKWFTGLGIKHLDAQFLYVQDNKITMGYDSDAFSCSLFKCVTIHQLRQMVADKTTSNGLLTPQQAKLAWVNGEDVQYSFVGDWYDIDAKTEIGIFDRKDTVLRIKPRTITLNGIEIPAPFEPKEGERYWWINPNAKMGYAWDSNDLEQTDFNRISMGVYRIEEDVVRVVAALRSILNAKP